MMAIAHFLDAHHDDGDDHDDEHGHSSKHELDEHGVG